MLTAISTPPLLPSRFPWKLALRQILVTQVHWVVTGRRKLAATAFLACVPLAACNSTRSQDNDAVVPDMVQSGTRPHLGEDHFEWGATRVMFERNDVVNVQPNVVFDSSGFLVADFTEARLARYLLNGSLDWVTGRKGQGPSEYQHPTRLHRLPNGHLLASDYDGKFVEYESNATSILRTFKVPFEHIEDFLVLDSVHVLIGARARDGKMLHFWNLQSDSEEKSAFDPTQHVANRMAAQYANYVQFAMHGDSIAVVFATSDSVYFFDEKAAQIGAIRLPSNKFRLVAPILPEGVTQDATKRRSWVATFDLMGGIWSLSDGSWIVAYKNLDPTDNMAAHWHLVHLTGNGDLLAEFDTPRLLTVAPTTDSLYFVSPSAEVPNQWTAASLH